MSKDPVRRPSSEDDPWEDLAEGLFGIEYGKEHASHEPAVPEPEEPPPEEVPFEPPVAEVSRPVPSDREAEEPPVIAAKLTEPAAPEPAKDPFWDALADWDWDDSKAPKSPPPTEFGELAPAPYEPRRPREESRRDSGRGGRGRDSRGGSGRSEGRGESGRGGPPRRSEAPRSESRRESSAPDAGRTSPKPAPARPAKPVDDLEGFGTGLIEDGGAPPDIPESAPKQREPEARPEQIAPPRGEERSGEGRGRRRRGRGRDDRRPAEPESPPRSVAEPAPDEPAPDDPAETVSGEGPEASGPRGRRRGRRRPDRFDETEHVFEVIEDDEPPQAAADDDDDEDLDDDDSVEAISYANVPSWEEAISYILNPQMVQLESGTPGGPPPKRSGSGEPPPRQTRHYGKRRP